MSASPRPRLRPPSTSSTRRAAVAAALLATALDTGCDSSTSNQGGISVDGHVVDTLGADVSFAVVQAGSQTTFTNAHGQFHLDHVATPYSLFVSETGAVGANVYEGLTSATPTVLVSADTNSQQTTIAGTVTGVTYPEPSGADTFVGVTTPYNYEDTSLPNATYSNVLVRWWGPITTPVDLLALRLRRDANQQPIAYDGLVTAHTNATSAVAVTGLALAMTDPPEAMVSGQVAGPTGTTPSLQAFVGKDGATALLTTLTGAAASTFSIVTPDPAGATIGLTALAGTTDGVGLGFVHALPPNATGVTVEAPAAPHWESPAAGSHGVGPGTKLSWSWAGAPNARMYLLRIGLSNGANAYDVYFNVVTTNEEFTIPDLSSLGFEWADGRDVVVMLFAIAGATTTPEDAAKFDVNHAVNRVYGGGMPEFDGAIGFNSNGYTFVSGP